MNKNIEVINENLWAVNIQYVKSGYINGLRIIPDTKTGQLNVTDAGIIVIDKASVLYPALKMLFLKIMHKTTDELEEILAKGIHMKTLDKVDDLLINVVGWEIKRRCVKADYLKRLPKPTFKYKFMIWIRKKVKTWLRFGRG